MLLMFHMKKTQQGFTLVELIVTIVILALLSSIAFLSVQWYSRSARNALRLDAISKLATAIDVESTSGIDMLAFAYPGQEITWLQLQWTGVTVGEDYIAGALNPVALRVSGSDFLDPISADIYLVWVTSKKEGTYEVAATIEEQHLAKSKVMGTYSPRTEIGIQGTWNIGEDIFTLSGYNDISFFFRNDYVSSVNLPVGTYITGISANGQVLSLSENFLGPSTSLQIAADETVGLILSEASGNSPVVDNSFTSLPYNIY